MVKPIPNFIYRCFYPNTSSFDNFYDKAIFTLAWRISMIFSFGFFVITSIYSFTGLTAALPAFMVFFVAISSFIFLYITKNYKPIFWVYSISGFALSHFALNTVMTLTHYVDFMWILVTIFMTFIGLGLRYGLISTIVNAILIAYFFWNSLNTHIVTIKPRTNLQLVGEYTEVVFSFIVAYYLIYLYFSFLQHSTEELSKTNKELEEQNHLITSKNNENTVLLKEVHHRVKNNLQIITSLLRLQKGNLPDEIKQKFDEAISRIMTMSLIHGKLYQTNRLDKIDIKSYINDLIHEISFSLNNSNIETKVNTEIDAVDLKTIVPLGLIINELLSNSFKHAFKNSEHGSISIQLLKSTPNEFELNYCDTGTWIENQNSSFGLELIETLTEQLDGTMKREGSNYYFKLKNLA